METTKNSFEFKPLGECLKMLVQHEKLITAENLATFLKRFDEEENFLSRNTYGCHDVVKKFLVDAKSFDEVRHVLKTAISMGFWGNFGYDLFSPIVYETIRKHFISGTPDQAFEGKKLWISYVKNGALSSYDFISRNAHCDDSEISEQDVSLLLQAGLYSEIMALVSHQKIKLTAAHKMYVEQLNQQLPMLWHYAYREQNHNSRPYKFEERAKRFEYLWEHAPWIFKKTDAFRIANFSSRLGDIIMTQAAGTISQQDVRRIFEETLEGYEGSMVRNTTLHFLEKLHWQADQETISSIRDWVFIRIPNHTEALGSDTGIDLTSKSVRFAIKKFGIKPNLAELLTMLGQIGYDGFREAVVKKWLPSVKKNPAILGSAKQHASWNDSQQKAFFQLIFDNELDSVFLLKSEQATFVKFLQSHLKATERDYQKISDTLARTAISNRGLERFVMFCSLFHKPTTTPVTPEFLAYALHMKKHADWWDFYENTARSTLAITPQECKKLVEDHTGHDNHPACLSVLATYLENKNGVKMSGRNIMEFMKTFKRPGDWQLIYKLFREAISYEDFLIDKKTADILEWFLNNQVIAMNEGLEDALVQAADRIQLLNLTYRSKKLAAIYETKQLSKFLQV